MRAAMMAAFPRICFALLKESGSRMDLSAVVLSVPFTYMKRADTPHQGLKLYSIRCGNAILNSPLSPE
jgi:hypothetical protein